jgi:hypothetical protein
VLLGRVTLNAVAEAHLVPLKCRAETLKLLSTGLTRFGPVPGEPQWLVSGVWLCCAAENYLATASTEVLANGIVARPLQVEPIDELVRQIATELPDMAARLVSRHSAVELPTADRTVSPPDALAAWPPYPYSTSVVFRISERQAQVEQVACALVFTSSAGSLLLVGTDPSSLAMVLSDEKLIIDRYCAACETVSLEEYLLRLPN